MSHRLIRQIRLRIICRWAFQYHCVCLAVFVVLRAVEIDRALVLEEEWTNIANNGERSTKRKSATRNEYRGSQRANTHHLGRFLTREMEKYQLRNTPMLLIVFPTNASRHYVQNWNCCLYSRIRSRE